MKAQTLLRYLMRYQHMSATQAVNGVLTCMNEIHILVTNPYESRFISQDEIIDYYLGIEPDVFYEMIGE